MNKLTKVVNGREVKNTKPDNLKEESAKTSKVKKLTKLKKSSEPGEVKGFTGTGGAGGAGQLDVENSNPDKN